MCIIGDMSQTLKETAFAFLCRTLDGLGYDARQHQQECGWVVDVFLHSPPSGRAHVERIYWADMETGKALQKVACLREAAEHREPPSPYERDPR